MMVFNLVGFTTDASSPGSISPVAGRQAGDLELMWAYRDGSNTAPSEPFGRGWTTKYSYGNGTNAARLLYRPITEANRNELMGTSSGATSLISAVYRPDAGYALSVGNHTFNGAAQANMVWGALSKSTNPPDQSLAVAFAGHRSTNTGIVTPPPGRGLVNVASVLDATDHAVMHHSLAQDHAWGWSEARASGGTTSGWQIGQLEVIATSVGVAPPAERRPIRTVSWL